MTQSRLDGRAGVCTQSVVHGGCGFAQSRGRCPGGADAVRVSVSPTAWRQPWVPWVWLLAPVGAFTCFQCVCQQQGSGDALAPCLRARLPGVGTRSDGSCWVKRCPSRSRGDLGSRAHVLWTWASSQKPGQSPLSWGGAGLGGVEAGGDRSWRWREGRVRGLWAPTRAPRGALRVAVGCSTGAEDTAGVSATLSPPPRSARKTGLVSGHHPEKCDPGKPGVRLEGAQLPPSFPTATPASANVDTLQQPLEARIWMVQSGGGRLSRER